MLVLSHTFHFVKVFYPCPAGVEELPPVELADQGHGWKRMFLVFPQDRVQFLEHESRADATEFQVGTEHGGGGLQTIRGGVGLLEFTNLWKGKN